MMISLTVTIYENFMDLVESDPSTQTPSKYFPGMGLYASITIINDIVMIISRQF